MKTQFNFPNLTLVVILFFSYLFTTNVNGQMTILTDKSDYRGQNISCNGMNDGWIRITTMNAVGNVTYTWSNGDSVDNVQNLTAGLYEVIVSDSVSSQNLTIELTEPSEITIATIVPATPYGYNLICNGDNTGRILTSATGGNGKLLYEWSNGSRYPNQASIAAGTYTLSVTDENNCLATKTEVLTEPAPMSITVTLVSQTTTCTSHDGSAFAVADGGQGGYNFLWDNSETLALASQLSVGFHAIKAIDHYGCSVRGDIEITSADGLSAPIGGSQTIPNNGGTISSGSRGSNTIFKPAILNNNIKNDGLIIQNVENFQENQLMISDMMGNVRVQLQNVKSVNDINVNLEVGHYVAVLTYKNENGETETVTNQISIR